MKSGLIESYSRYYSDKLKAWLIQPNDYISVYHGSIQDQTPYIDKDSAECHEIMKAHFESELFWDKTLEFASLEKQGFSKNQSDTYKRIFVLYQDSPFSVVVPKLTRLVNDIKETSSQRAAAELIAGILRGSKHWNSFRKELLNEVIVPLLFQGIALSTMETITHWLACLRYAFSRRDPNRFTLIINRILDTPLDLANQSFLAESKKIWLKDLVLTSFNHSMRKHTPLLVTLIVEMMSTPYQQVRDALGRMLDNCLAIEDEGRFNSVEDYLDSCFKGWNRNVAIKEDSTVKAIFVKLNDFKSKSGPEFALASKTALSWFASSLASYKTIRNILPIMTLQVIEMQDYSDQDLNAMCSQVIRIIPNFQHTPLQLEMTLSSLTTICVNAEDWHVKQRILPLLQVLYFRHLFQMTERYIDQLLDLLFLLLKDPQVEVRQLTAITLSGIVQCSLLDISSMSNRFKESLAGCKLPKKKRTEAVNAEYTAAVNARHASVLGLSSLVLSHPYGIPGWMPSILVLLADCSSDPSPISVWPYINIELRN